MKKTIQRTGVALAFLSIITFTAVDAMAQNRYGRGGCPEYGKGRGYGKSFHQNRGRYHNRGHFRGIERLKVELKLTETQVIKIMDIMHEFRKNVYKNQGNYNKILEYKVEMRKKISGILNAEQKKKFEAMPFGKRHHRPYRRMGR